jgi:pimeloyl-ACP methyl ester carboxylesterase
MTYVLVHGLGLSSNIWSSLIRLLEDEIVAVNLPGHGNSSSTDISWTGIWRSVKDAAGSVELSETTIVMHSFAACLIPEICSEPVQPKKIVLIEGILLPCDALWSGSIVHLCDDDFRSWLSRFRSVSEMTLKSQLVTKQPKDKLIEWSNAFRIADGDALRCIAVNLNERLNSGLIAKTLNSGKANITYVKSSRSRLSIDESIFQGLTFCEIENSGHFPMIDNPVGLANIILNKIIPIK